jgi:hypothetical protein
VPLEADAHHVPRLALEPVGGGPDGKDARDRLAVVEPHLHADACRVVGDAEKVVRDREPLRLRVGDAREPLRARDVEVTPRSGSDVAGDSLLAPAEVVGRGDVAQEVEAVLVAERGACLDESRGIDDQRCLAACLARLDDAWHGRVHAHSATPRISYAGGTPPRIFSWSRTIPSMSASGRGGQPGTWMSTGTILSTPWRIV